MESFAFALSRNTSLITVDLSYNKIEDEGVITMNSYMKNNNTL